MQCQIHRRFGEPPGAHGITFATVRPSVGGRQWKDRSGHARKTTGRSDACLEYDEECETIYHSECDPASVHLSQYHTSHGFSVQPAHRCHITRVTKSVRGGGRGTVGYDVLFGHQQLWRDAVHWYGSTIIARWVWRTDNGISGSSSGFSIFSPKGIQWVNEKTGDTSFQDMISSAYVDDNKWMYWKPEIFSDIFARRVFKPLPPKEEALSLFKDFFQNFNCMFPLFHEATFMHLVERQYSRDPYEGSGWWASINVVLAISHRLRVMSNLVPHEEDKKAWLYLKNAMGVLTELTMRNTDLLSVQALLGMSLFLQGTPNPQPAFFLVAAAIRLSHSIGLHKRGSGFGLNPVEVEQRKRVFWIAYCLDKDLCLRSGRPPVQDDDDMNVELPSEDPPDNVGNVPLADGKGKFNLFRSLCEFATIESSVYKRLYSAKASKQSDGELLNTIGELDKELEDWKDSIPIDFRPENEIQAIHGPLLLHVVVLHFAYYNCLTTIHRMSVHHGYWTSRLSDYAIQGLNARPLNPRVFLSAVLCVTAARASINLIKYIPQGDFACVW